MNMRIACFLVVTGSAIAMACAAAAQDQDALVKRGEYLMNGPVACANCHTPRNPDMSFQEGMDFAGGFKIVDPAFEVYTANITPDPETGIGTWSDEEIVVAIREGKTPDGKIVWPPMPVPIYNNMSDDDVNALIAYLRTVKPIHNEVPESRYNIPQQAMPPAKGLPAPAPDDEVAYGGYIVNALAHCFECHTPMGPEGPDMSKMGAGGFEIELAPGMTVRTANITPDPETGIGTWSDDDIKKAITQAVTPDGQKLSPPMPYPFFKNMTDEDLDAVVAYLRTVPAVNNQVERTDFQKQAFP